MNAPTTPAPYHCAKCNKLEHGNYERVTKTRMLKRQMCFECDFWTRYLEKKNDADVVRVSGSHYVIQPDLPKGADPWCAGHGGRGFEIIYKDGRRVITCNLWHQGEIPELFRAEMPDNAVGLRSI